MLKLYFISFIIDKQAIDELTEMQVVLNKLPWPLKSTVKAFHGLADLICHFTIKLFALVLF